jgi:mitogen-activated protein kinase kinase kinase
LFSGDYEKVKLIDLGVSNHLDKTKATRKAGHGTPRYMSPEQLDGKLSFKCDIWALGCVLLEFATGVKPFENVVSEVAMCLKIFQGCSPLDYALENNNAEAELIIENDDFKELLKLCFKNDYKQRPSAEELFENSFFSGYTTNYY